MMTGRDNLQLINQRIYQTQTEQEYAGQRLEELHRQLNAVVLATGERYRELARLRLDDLQARTVISRLDETDKLVLSLLEKLKQTRNDLDEQIKDSISRQRQLEEQRAELERQRDGAGETLQRQLEQTRTRLQATEAYRLQQQRAQQAAAVAKHAD